MVHVFNLRIHSCVEAPHVACLNNIQYSNYSKCLLKVCFAPGTMLSTYHSMCLLIYSRQPYKVDAIIISL